MVDLPSPIVSWPHEAPIKLELSRVVFMYKEFVGVACCAPSMIYLIN